MLPNGRSHHDILLKRHWHSLHTQAGIRIHCIPTSGHSHSRHTHKGTFASYGHSHHGIVPSGHSHHGIPTRGHLHHDIPTWTFTSWHTYMNICIIAYHQKDIHIIACTKGTFASLYTYKGTFVSWHLYKGHSHHSMHKRTSASWHPYKKHWHHDIPSRRHLHHETFRISILARRHLHRNLNMCTGAIMNKLHIFIPA